MLAHTYEGCLQVTRAISRAQIHQLMQSQQVLVSYPYLQVAQLSILMCAIHRQTCPANAGGVVGKTLQATRMQLHRPLGPDAPRRPGARQLVSIVIIYPHPTRLSDYMSVGNRTCTLHTHVCPHLRRPAHLHPPHHRAQAPAVQRALGHQPLAPSPSQLACLED